MFSETHGSENLQLKSKMHGSVRQEDYFLVCVVSRAPEMKLQIPFPPGFTDVVLDDSTSWQQAGLDSLSS